MVEAARGAGAPALTGRNRVGRRTPVRHPLFAQRLVRGHERQAAVRAIRARYLAFGIDNPDEPCAGVEPIRHLGQDPAVAVSWGHHVDGQVWRKGRAAQELSRPPHKARALKSSCGGAAMQGDTAAKATALRRGAAIDSLDTRRNRSGRGRRALNWAAWHNGPDAIRFLVARGTNINLPSRSGFTLHHAVENRSPEAVRVLVALGADREVQNRLGRRPIDFARQREYSDLVALLEPTPRQ